MTTITGTINEARRTFSGEGRTGEVSFGRSMPGWGQHVRVALSDGTEAYGNYRNAGDVRLTLKAQYNRAGKRVGK